MNHYAPRVMAMLVCFAVLPLVGCKMTQSSLFEPMGKLKFPGADKTEALQKIGPTRVVTDATAFALELPESELEERERFFERFNSLVGDERLAAANILVARRLDLAHEVLTSNLGKNAENLQTLAATYDQNCGTSRGWYAVAVSSATEAVAAYAQQRQQFMGALANGDFVSASEVELVE
ncbi:MAG: hypothetical protein AAFU85_31555, partial [Planctomycetota bacterium]